MHIYIYIYIYIYKTLPSFGGKGEIVLKKVS